MARISACQVLFGTARGGPGFNSPLPSIFDILKYKKFFYWLIYAFINFSSWAKHRKELIPEIYQLHQECTLHPAEREVLRKVSPELDLKILLDTKKGLDAVVKFLYSLPELLCWWFALLSSLLKLYWASISDINLLSVMYCRFPSKHRIIHGELGSMEHLNL